MSQGRCGGCGAFTKSGSHASCRRCARADKAIARRLQRAERALTKLQHASQTEHWKLVKLRRAIATQQRRIGLTGAHWEPIVRTVFGTSTVNLVDPRQMVLFAVTETSCPPPASPSPSLSPSA